MTEDEARKKWCPHRQNGIPVTTLDYANCIASNCMMWRQSEQLLTEGSRLEVEIIHGYCGLAGKPTGD